MMLISVVITTYNRPDALRAVLAGLAAQTDHGFEVIVADDGSAAETGATVAEVQMYFPVQLTHVWQEDLGFRAGAARNRAVESASGEYLLFLDGDCVPRPDFIEAHRALAEPGWMVAGNRILLSKTFTEHALATKLPLHAFSIRDWKEAKTRGHVNRRLPLFKLPLGPLRKLTAWRWQRVRGCNLGVWRDDFTKVSGFDESFEGWGFEDSDLAVRLLNAGVRRKEGAFATGVLHLWHAENDRRHEGRNWALLQQRISSRETQPTRGLKRVTDS